VIDRVGMLRAFRLDEFFRAQLGGLAEANESPACIIDMLCQEVHIGNQGEVFGDIAIASEMTLLGLLICISVNEVSMALVTRSRRQKAQ
jgi:hypothetical protein